MQVLLDAFTSNTRCYFLHFHLSNVQDEKFPGFITDLMSVLLYRTKSKQYSVKLNRKFMCHLNGNYNYLYLNV